MDEHFENSENIVQAMCEWIEFYNNNRIRTKLKGKSPVKYRELANQLTAYFSCINLWIHFILLAIINFFNMH
ncbi:MAG: IS3 family transposase [Liquorilactobacillus ghanensis]